ncbi:MAG: ROK family transcriptional regulator [Propionivibrio sp.]
MATPQSIRYLNKVQALNAMFRGGGMSRSDLARRLGLNRASVGYIVQDLLAEGLAVEHPEAERADGNQRSGRPGIVVSLNPAGAEFVGVEIGVDHITVAIVDLVGNECRRQSVDYATATKSPKVGLRKVTDLIHETIESLMERESRVRGICVAVPGLIRDGVVVNALMLGWRDLPLQDILQDTLGPDMKVMVENDANALAIGVTYPMPSEPTETVACLNIENGVGGGIAIGGKLFRGASGFSGEFGQLPLGGKGFCSGPFRPGHLESYIGKEAVLARYEANGGTATPDFNVFLQALEQKEKEAVKTAHDWADRLAQGLTQVIHVINPGRIVLGGSVAQIYQYVQNRVQSTVEREFLAGFPLPDIGLPSSNTGGTAFGAACLLHQFMFSIDEDIVHATGDSPMPRRSSNSRRPTRTAT